MQTGITHLQMRKRSDTPAVPSRVGAASRNYPLHHQQPGQIIFLIVGCFACAARPQRNHDIAKQSQNYSLFQVGGVYAIDLVSLTWKTGFNYQVLIDLFEGMTISVYQQIFASHAIQPKVTTMFPKQGVLFSVISEAALLPVKSQLR